MKLDCYHNPSLNRLHNRLNIQILNNFGNLPTGQENVLSRIYIIDKVYKQHLMNIIFLN